MHKDKFLCIFSQIKRITHTLTVHLVHAPSFWWSPSCSFTFSFLCVFFQFLYVVRFFCLRFLCLVFVPWLSSFWITVVTLDFTGTWHLWQNLFELSKNVLSIFPETKVSCNGLQVHLTSLVFVNM
jgi:hypothetical protein